MWVFMLYQQCALRHNNMLKKKKKLKNKYTEVSLSFNTFVFKILNVSFCCVHLTERGKLMLQKEVKRGFYLLTLLL